MTDTTPRDPSAIDASLHLLTRQILDELSSGDLAPCLLHVAPDDDGVRLGMKDLEGHHPTNLLLGFVAPPEWHAIGSATAGRAYDLDDRAERTGPHRRVHTVMLVSRTGEVAQRTVVNDDPELTARLNEPAEEVVGEQIDLLRLALELPTEPPPCEATVYWSIEWLAALLATDTPATTWRDVVTTHPFVRLIIGDDEEGSDADWCVEQLARLREVATWTSMRSLTAQGLLSMPGLCDRDARWLDDGAFARFVLTRCPPLSGLRAQVADVLPPSLGRRLDETLDELGVPRAAWPDTVTV
jgi:hypothetical protein